MTSLDPEDFVGRSIGPYTIESLHGEGGFSWVFAARHRDGRAAALKVLRPHYAGERGLESRFRNESSVARELDHPNIVHIQDAGSADGVDYFAMDLYPDSLSRRLERDGTLPEPDLLQAAGDIASALAFAHARGIVHRDIKTDNILYRADRSAVLADFGISRPVKDYASETGANMTIGTPHYISPEQAQGFGADSRSDLYALGITLYKATTGSMPFHSNDWFELARMHVEAEPEPPRSRRPELTARFEEVILRCLAKHPDDRFSSADAMVDEIGRIRKTTA